MSQGDGSAGALAPDLLPYGLSDLQAAARTVYALMPPTPQYRWPLLEAGFAQQPGDARAQRFEQLVARHRAPRIVDVLEAVHIDDD